MKNTRRLRQGAVSTVIAVLFIAVIVVLNMVAGILTDRYNLTVDLTAEQAFVLTDQSKEYIAGLDKDLTIYVLTAEQNLTSGNVYLVQANEVIKQYAHHSPRIRVEYVDLNRWPDFKSSYSQYQLNDQTILLDCEGATSTLTLYDLFNISTEDYYGQYVDVIVSSKAEQVMTGAIMNLTATEKVTVTLLEGFGEEGAEYLASLLTTNNYEVTTTNIMTGEIDPDADVAVICAPIRDYSEEALAKLDAFLSGGGDLGKSIFYLADIAQQQTPNLNAFLADWGIAVDDGIVFQSDLNQLMAQSYFWSIADYGEDVIAKNAMEQRLYTVVPEARPLSVLFDSRGNKTVTVPLTFSSTTSVRPLEADETWTPAQAERTGPIPALVLSTETIGEAASHVVVAGTSLLLDQSVLLSPNVGNSECLLGLFGYLTGYEAGVDLAPKTIGTTYMPITVFQSNLLGILFVVVLPLVVVFIGGVVFFRRRHL